MIRVFPLFPFALSLSKGSAEPQAKRASLRSAKGFDFAQPERVKVTP